MMRKLQKYIVPLVACVLFTSVYKLAIMLF